jgi:nicotinamide-nucleotide amidase
VDEFRLTIGVAESVTCGHLQALIGNHRRLAEIFKGGITAYSIEQKVKHLGVDAAHASRTDCVSARVADEMATGVCCLFGVEVGLATTGYAEPPRKGKAPFAYWSLCRNDGASLKIVKRGKVTGSKNVSRKAMQSQIAEIAFRALTAYVEAQKS